jgi:hypothetical protein
MAFPGNGALAWLRARAHNTMTNAERPNHDFFEPSNFLPMSLPGRLEVRTEVGWSMVKIKIITTQLDPKNALKLSENLRIGEGLCRTHNPAPQTISHLFCGPHPSARASIPCVRFVSPIISDDTIKRGATVGNEKHTRPTLGATFAGGATSFSRSSLTKRW